MTERRGERSARRTPRVAVFAAAVLGAFAVAACGSGESEDAIRKSSSSIISGYADSAHPATVSLGFMTPLGGIKACSGTIIKFDPATGTGLVLTAAHCGYATGGTDQLRPIGIVVGDDWASTASKSYPATGWEPYPDDLGDTSAPYHRIFDVGVVMFRGAPPETPVMPLRTSNVLPTAGQPATLVGFGTGLNAQANSRRLAVDSTVESASIFTTHTVSPVGGSCYGDSGGPLSLDEGGTKVLAGIISTGDAVCGPTNGRTDSVNVFSPHVAQWLSKFGVATAPTTPPEPTTPTAPPAPPASGRSCAVPGGGTIASGASVVAYGSLYGTRGLQCSDRAETRVCNDGYLSGSHSSPSCNNYPCESHGAYFTWSSVAFPSATFALDRTDAAICGPEKWLPLTSSGPHGGCEFWGYYVNSGTCAAYQGTVYECVNTTWTVAPPSVCPTLESR